MKLILRANMFILFILMLLSCNDDNLVKRLDPGIEINEELTVGPAASREVIHLKSTYPWYAETSVSWIKMVRYRGQYTKPDSIVMEIQENPDMEERESWIEVRLMDQMSTKIHVLQKGRGSLITLSKNNIIFNKNGGEATIDVSTQLEWEIDTEGLEGITATKENESQFKIVISENNTGNELTRELFVRSVDKTTEAKLVIVQANVEDILSISLSKEEKDILIEKAANELDIPVSLNMDYQCTVSDDWISVTENPNFEGDIVQDINIKVSVSANSGVEERYGYVCIKNLDESVTDTFHISQMAHSKRIYVKAGNVDGDGTSWERAFGTMEEGRAAATDNGDMEIWVAKGDYQLSGWHQLKKINYYGGFDGTENKLKDRNTKNKSTLIAAPNEIYASVYGYSTGGNVCIIDGFVFTGSNATYSSGADGTSVLFYNAWVFRNNIVTGNNCYRDAGGVYSGCEVYNCLIYNNNTTTSSSTVNVTEGTKVYNCTIVNNTSSGSSSGLRLGNNTGVYNSVIWNNVHTAGSNNNVYLDSQGSGMLKNCAVEGRLTFNNAPSSTEGSFILGSSNTAADGPNFVSVENNDYSLSPVSPLIDKGAEWSGFNLIWDIIGNDRKWGGAVDIGAYEFIGNE